MSTPAIQTSKLLPALFDHIDEEQRLTVFDVGPALSSSLDFFSNYRCKLHFVDLFLELPIRETEDTPTLAQQVADLLPLQDSIKFDICLFWDIFNFLSGDAIEALMSALQPHLKASTIAHAFSVHNIKAPQCNHVYGIQQVDTFSLGQRPRALPGYAPHSQRQLKEHLPCFHIERSVLLPDSRLELLLQAKL